MAEPTTISVSTDCADFLHDLKNRSDTYEDVIWRLAAKAGHDVDESHLK